ncbi:uncharacterized protein IWZ02DRAFT_432767 [Phyllosticta citriasiana]|uniref:Uncharacterized protein n=1 Tax=Phyllosticta citriasiana TaxID=595635 RepID=A0ABR1KRD3_9PEZI
MGRISESSKRAAKKMRTILSLQRRLKAQAGLSMKDDAKTRGGAPNESDQPVEHDLPVPVARSLRARGQAGFRFLAGNESASTVASSALEDLPTLARCGYRAPDDKDQRQHQSSMVQEPHDADPRSEERSDTSSLFGTSNPWGNSAVWGDKEKREVPKLRLPSFVRNRAEKEKERAGEASGRVKLSEGEEWELHPDEVGPIQFSSQNLFSNPTGDGLGPRRVEKRFSV